MPGNSDLIDIEVDLKHETDKAYLVSDGDREVWVPKSQCEFEMSDTPPYGTLTLPEWLAEDKELI